MGRNAALLSGLLLAAVAAVIVALMSAGSNDSVGPGPANDARHGTPGLDGSVLPLHFEENVGQAAPWARFVARGPGPDLLLGPSALALGGVSLELAGAAPGLSPVGGSALAGRVDYLLGSDPDRWLTDVPSFSEIVYPDAYPGIDVRYHGDSGALEQDFVVEPFADPAVISLVFDPAARLGLRGGDLVVATETGSATLHAPVAYQVCAGTRRSVEARFDLEGNRVSFALGSYDPGVELVIDPVISYASFLGGEMSDVGNGIAATLGGTVLVTGRTGSADFPSGETDPPGNDAFVIAIDPSRSGAASLVYKAYLGGNNQDEGFGIAAGPGGTIYVTGKTQSTDFPTVNAFDTTNNAEDAFLTKIDPSLAGAAAVVYSTYLGGTGADSGADVAVDTAGRGHVTGDTQSAAEFPLKNALDATVGGADAFLVTIDPAVAGAAGLVFGTYLGGDGSDSGRGVALDSAGRVFVAGETQSATGFPIANALDTTLGGTSDGFLLHLDPAAAGPDALLYGTYLGGSAVDLAADVAPGSGGGALVAGETMSADFPVRNPLSGTLRGAQDGFVAKLMPGSAGDASLAWSSYLGGDDADQSTGVASDPAGNAFVVGLTASGNFPTTPDRLQGDQAMTDAYISKIGESSPSTPVLIYSSYVGGSAGGPTVNMPFDRGNGIAADGVGSAAITGETFSLDVAASGPGFDLTCGSDATCNGGAASDGWVTRTSFAADLKLEASLPKARSVGKPFNLVLTVSGAGPDAATGLTVTSAAPSGTAIGAPTASQGSCAITGQTVTCALGLLLGGGSATVTIPMTPGTAGRLLLAPTVAAQEPDPLPADNTVPLELIVRADAGRPRLSVGPKRPRLSRKGVVVLKLRCQSPAPGICRGRLRLTSARPIDTQRILASPAAKTVLKLAERRYRIRKGKPRRLPVKLTRRGRAVIEELGRLRVVVTVKARDSAGARATLRRKIVIREGRG